MAASTTPVSPPLRSSSAGSSWIQPALPVEATAIPCSAIENLCARVYPSPALFFPLQADEDPLRLYAHLSRGLSRVLSGFPFLAGRLRQDGRGAFSIEIPDSPLAGTHFHYADLNRDFTFPSFEDLRAAGFPYGDGNLDGLGRLAPSPFPHHQDGCPVIIPQLAHVRGGLVLTCSYSHLVADLLLFSAWCNTWAAQTREVITAAAECRPESPAPQPCAKHMIDRTQLTPPNPGLESLPEMSRLAKAIPDWLLVDPTDAVALENMKSIVPPAYVPSSDASVEEGLRSSSTGVWRFPVASLEALHRGVQKASKTSTKITPIDVLTAYLWAHVFRAKYISPVAPNDTSHMPQHSEIVYAGDIRRRLSPPLPKDFLGAGVDLFRCAAEASTLAAPGTEVEELSNIAHLATAIRDSNRQWSEESYMTLLGLSQRTPLSPGFVPRGPIDVLTTDHSRGASVIVANWGPGLGSPVAMREPYLGRDPPAGEVTILPGCANGDLEVMISAERVVLERLKVDRDMKRRSKVGFVLHDVAAQMEKHSKRARL